MSTSNQVKILREQADKLGIQYHHKHGADTLRAKIGELLLADPAKAGLLLSSGQSLEMPAGNEPEVSPIEPNLEYEPLTGDEYKIMSQKKARLQIGALRRIKFTNMNPTKKGWPGEPISVGSARLGTFKKYVFFNGEPYHVPQIIYDVMKERMCSSFYTVTNKRGGDVRKSKLIHEYAITDLDPLTPEELKDLAARQQLHSVGL